MLVIADLRPPSECIRTWKFLLLSLALVALLAQLGLSQTYFQTRLAGAVLSGTTWANPENALGAADDICATTLENNAYLYVGGFGFNIPVTATILGIAVRLKAGHSSGGSFGLYLLKNGTPTGQWKTVSPGSVGTCAETGWKSWGSSTDLWGASWSPTDVNASGFGVRVGSGGTAGTRFVDTVEITVYYALPSLAAPGDWNPHVPRGSTVESGDLSVIFSYAPPGSSVTVAVGSIYPSAPQGFRLWIKGPDQMDYVELALTEPYGTAVLTTNLSGTGSFSLRLRADARAVERTAIGTSFTITLIYTLVAMGG